MYAVMAAKWPQMWRPDCKKRISLFMELVKKKHKTG